VPNRKRPRRDSRDTVAVLGAVVLVNGGSGFERKMEWMKKLRITPGETFDKSLA